MKAKLLVFGVAALCLSVTPVNADLFHWTVHNLDLSYDGADFNAVVSANDPDGGQILFTRDVDPKGTISLFPEYLTDQSNFTVDDMVISDITASTANGVGTFTLTDRGGDTITGDVTGVWTKTGTGPQFSGTLSNVLWNSADNDFDGYKQVGLSYVADSVSMDFSTPQPWNGSMVELTADSAPWFGLGGWSQVIPHAGSIDAHVVPVPAAVLLGLLGLGAAGLKLRRLA